MLLPSTQVTCERVFSKLKVIKIKLRSSLDQQHLEPLILMAIEKDIILHVDKIKLIDVHSKNVKRNDKTFKLYFFQFKMTNIEFICTTF